MFCLVQCFIHIFFLLQPLNTLFMHFFVAVDEYSTGCLKEIIRWVGDSIQMVVMKDALWDIFQMKQSSLEPLICL